MAQPRLKANQEELLPDPKRLSEGLRDTGYEFDTAVADIVDNSIAAEATSIAVTLEMDMTGEIRLMVADNGLGMDKEGLRNAMKYGSRVRPSKASLGKFGLGLKTASTAFCRRLAVTSRNAGKAKAQTAVLDLDDLVDHWVISWDEPADDVQDTLDTVAPRSSGTVVVWEKVDRFLNTYTERGGAFHRKALKQAEENLREHLSLIYQRFLDPKFKEARNISITVNGTKLTPWDPFMVSHSTLVATETPDVELEGKTKSSFMVKAYVLPRKDAMTKEEEQLAKISVERQGVYIYRENRLIVDASWLRMFQKEPHSNLLRVEFSFDNTLDDAFRVDVKKSKIELNKDLAHWLKDEFLPAPRRAAAQEYRVGRAKDVKDRTQTAHDTSNKAIHKREGELDDVGVKVVNEKKGTVQLSNAHGKVTLKLKLEKAGKPDELHVKAVDSLDDGLLFQPAIIEGRHKAVLINRAHPYYSKVYVPNLGRDVTVQGMDSLLWAMSMAELSAVSEDTAKTLEELRYDMSRKLRKLVDDLPEPDLDESKE